MCTKRYMQTQATTRRRGGKPATMRQEVAKLRFTACAKVASGYPAVMKKCMSSSLILNIKKGNSPNRDLTKKLQDELYRSILNELNQTKQRLERRLRNVKRKMEEILPEPFKNLSR
jgi:hypothetical protein